MRQGSLAFERNLNVKKWYTRYWQSILGIICVNSHLAYQLEHTSANELETVAVFSEKPAIKKLLNDFIGNQKGQRNSSTLITSMEVNLEEKKEEEPHFLKPIRCLEERAKKKENDLNPDIFSEVRQQLICSECKSKASMYCHTFYEKSGKIIAICGRAASKNRRDCLSSHFVSLYL